ncbi:MAG: hypothetical protein KatS3mg035_0540 [Bacteroidia bacterium]|nr:MAG: hypothetical protein KatS3mg035_0540 [Bacteroidia bacterium]
MPFASLTLTLSLASPSLHSQYLDSLTILKKARFHIDTLCSNTFKGRGYMNNGHVLAAEYIKKQFTSFGLNPICSSGMIQNFNFPLNLIQDAELIINHQKLIPSKDFLPAPHTPSVEIKNVRPQYIGYGSHENWQKIAKKANKKWIIIEDGMPNNIPDNLKDSLKKWYSTENQIKQAKMYDAGGLIIKQKKLTHSFAAEPINFPVLFIQENIKIKTIDHYAVKTRAGTQFSQNVIAFQRGIIDSTIVICAHYDHLGSIGETIFKGANDNASGIAFLLVLAEQVAKIQTKYNILWIAFGAEETGLNGSLYYVMKNACTPLEKIKYVLNFDLLGHGQEGVMAVGAKTYPDLFREILSINEQLGKPLTFSERPNAPNSDHYPFTLKNIPALFFYTMGGPKHYHDYLDLPEGLELTSFVSMQKIVLKLIE